MSDEPKPFDDSEIGPASVTGGSRRRRRGAKKSRGARKTRRSRVSRRSRRSRRSRN